MKDSEYTALVRANNALTTRVKKSHNKPKTDCVFFGKATITPSCQCLKELYCKVENCSFYKQNNDQTVADERISMEDTRIRYEITCPYCRHVQYAGKPIFHEMGIEDGGCRTCLRCGKPMRLIFNEEIQDMKADRLPIIKL